MNKIGFIGYGHMGSTLIKSLLSAKAIESEQLIISNRTQNKLEQLKSIYPEITVAKNNIQVAQNCSVIFLCVGTFQVKSVLSEIIDKFSNDVHLISISGGLEIASIEKIFNGSLTKIIPTLICEINEGVTLVCHNSKVTSSEQKYLNHLLRQIGKTKIISENQFEVGSDFTSCAPGLFASIFDQYIKIGIEKGKFSYEEATDMLLRTLYGTSKLLLQNKEDFKSLIDRVATKGSATEGGVSVLNENLPAIFEKVFDVTIQRNEIRKQKTRLDYNL
jgi:pyrroline-5-carboxylate reductase